VRDDSGLGAAPLEIAVVGSGGAGLAAAWALAQRHRVTLFEAAPRPGGHANTVTLDDGGKPLAIDTGFIVYNEVNYPNLVRWLDTLRVATKASNMSFAFSLDGGRYEYAGSLTGLFAQRGNLLNPGHWYLVREILRFFREAQAQAQDADAAEGSLADFLDRRGFGQAFRERHLLPMAAAIWSSSPGDILSFPLKTFLTFFRNHGLLRVKGRPQWRTVAGGSQRYVEAVTRSLGSDRVRLGTAVAGLERGTAGHRLLLADGSVQSADQVVLACHGDEALTILGENATSAERRILSAFRYSTNRAILHRDAALMPRRRAAWSSWNYLAERSSRNGAAAVTYWMNALQNLETERDYFVSLNPAVEPSAALTLGTFSYSHPLFDEAAVAAQDSLPEIQGKCGTWFCGSYCGYGFHEDAVQAGFGVAKALGAPPPWSEEIRPMSSAVRALPENAVLQGSLRGEAVR